MSCHFLLQGILPTQGSNPCLLGLLHWQVDFFPLCHLGSPQIRRKVESNQDTCDSAQVPKWWSFLLLLFHPCSFPCLLPSSLWPLPLSKLPRKLPASLRSSVLSHASSNNVPTQNKASPQNVRVCPSSIKNLNHSFSPPWMSVGLALVCCSFSGIIWNKIFL